jgi:arylsulfatase A
MLPQAVGDDAAKAKPNILLIVADDLGVSDLHCYGRTDHRTPNLDALAERGIRYESAYCGLSICSASRAALMTGKYPSRLHITSFLPGRSDAPSQLLLNARIQDGLPAEERTLAEELRAAGYRTGLFGKWHLGGGVSKAANQGFDVVVEPPHVGKPDDSEGSKHEFTIARAAGKFLSESSSQPWFCYVPQHSPHISMVASEESLKANASTWNPLYASNVEALDRSVGMLVESANQASHQRETIIIFTSDNGGLHVREGHPEILTRNEPYRAGKGYLYEGGVRIPLIVTSTKFASQPRVVREPISHLDLYPTLLAIAGVDVPKTIGPVDGMNQSDHWLQGKALDSERPFFWHFPHYTNQGSRPASAMRKGKWKFIRHYETETEELFDLETDLGETTNRIAQHSEVASSMRQQLDQWLTSTGAQMCKPNPEADRHANAAIYNEFDSSQLKVDASAKELGERWAIWRQRMNEATKNRVPVIKKSEGDIMIHARDGMAHGVKLLYEREPHKNVIGYWTHVEDWVHWDFEVPSDGEYEVEVQCGCGSGHGGSRAVLICQDQRLEWSVRDTGHFQNMAYEPIGTLKLTQGKQRVEIRALTKANVAIMDVRTIVLRKQK